MDNREGHVRIHVLLLRYTLGGWTGELQIVVDFSSGLTLYSAPRPLCAHRGADHLAVLDLAHECHAALLLHQLHAAAIGRDGHRGGRLGTPTGLRRGGISLVVIGRSLDWGLPAGHTKHTETKARQHPT